MDEGNGGGGFRVATKGSADASPTPPAPQLDLDILRQQQRRLKIGRFTQWLIQNAALAAVLVLVVPPVAMLLYGSVRDAPPGRPGSFTLDNYIEAFTDPRYVGSLKNTLIMASAVMIVASVLGTVLAWIVFRTNLAGRRIIMLAVTVSFFFPNFIGAIAWAILASPNAGIMNIFLRNISENWGINIYSMPGIIWVLVLSYLPYTFMFCSGPFQAMDPALEDAARTCGASNFKVAMTVTLPLVRYSILSAAMLIFVHSMGVFGVPAILGQPAGIYVLATRLRRLTEDYPQNLALAAAIGMLMVGLTCVMLILQRRYLRGSNVTSITGRGYRPTLVDLGRYRYLALGFCAIYLFFAVLLPTATIFFRSLVPYFAPEQGEPLHLGFDNYRKVLFEYPITGRAFANSLLLSGVGGAVAVILCTVVAYLIIRGTKFTARVLDIVSTIPIGVPGLVIGAGLLWAYLRFPIGVYGTMWIMFLSYMCRYLPFGVNSISSSLVQIDKELEEASYSSGATWFSTMRHVIVPLIWPAMVGAYVLLFVDFFKELSSAVLLYSTGNEVISVAIWDLYENSEWGMAAALAMISLVIVYGLLALILIFRPSTLKTVQ